MVAMISDTGKHTLFSFYDTSVPFVTFIPLDVQLDTHDGDHWITLTFTVDTSAMVGHRLATMLTTEQPLILQMQWYVPVETCKRYLCRVMAFTCDPVEGCDRVVVTAHLLERL